MTAVSKIEQLYEVTIGKSPRTYQSIAEENVRLRQKVWNYRRAMKQLQRAHVVTLYAKQRAEEAANYTAERLNEAYAEIAALRAEISATRDVALRRGEALRDARHELQDRRVIG